MAVEPIRIPIKVEGAAEAARQLDLLGKRSKQGASSVDRLKTAVLALGSALTARGVFNLGVEFQNLDRRLRSVSKGSEDLEKNFLLLKRVSEDSRSSLSDNAAAFQRIKIATEQVGASSEDAARIVNTLNKAFAIGGASVEEARGALLQLGQGLGSGALQGDELRTLRESASFLANTLAKELGVDGVGALKKLGQEGKLTSEVLVSALLRAGEKIDKQYSELPKTFGEAITELRNELVLFGETILPVVNGAIEGIGRIVEAARIAAIQLQKVRSLFDQNKANVRFENQAREQDPARLRVIQESQQLREFAANLDRIAANQKAVFGEVSPELQVELEKVNERIYFMDRALASASGGATALGNELQSASEKAQASFEEAQASLDSLKLESLGVEVTPGLGGGGGGGEATGPLKPLIDDIGKIPELSKEAFAEFDRFAQEAFEKAQARYNLLSDSLTSVFQGIGDAWIDYLQTGEFAFEDFASNIIGDLARILQQALITQAVTALLGGAPTAVTGQQIGGAQFALGFRADGGPVSSGQPYMVGERGPELFVPKQAGSVVPNEALGGGGPINLTVVNQIGKEEFVKVIDERVESPDGASKMLGGLNKKKTQAKRLFS